jgi:hypothetical protein
MRRIPIALALTTTLLLALTADPAVAAPRFQVVGERLDLRAGEQNFPASVPFHINHGFVFPVGDNKRGLDKFTLDLDGTPLTADYIRRSPIGSDGLTVDEQWYYNFATGLTGAHEFIRHYFTACDNIDVSCDGNRINTPVETFTASAVVTFTP